MGRATGYGATGWKETLEVKLCWAVRQEGTEWVRGEKKKQFRRMVAFAMQVLIKTVAGE